MKILNNLTTVFLEDRDNSLFPMGYIKKQLEEIFSKELNKTFKNLYEVKTIRTGTFTTGTHISRNNYEEMDFEDIYNIYSEYYEKVTKLLEDYITLAPIPQQILLVSKKESWALTIDGHFVEVVESIFDIQSLPYANSEFYNNYNPNLLNSLLTTNCMEFTKCAKISDNLYFYYDNLSDILVLSMSKDSEIFKLENWSKVCDFMYPFTKLKYLPDSKLVETESDIATSHDTLLTSKLFSDMIKYN